MSRLPSCCGTPRPWSRFGVLNQHNGRGMCVVFRCSGMGRDASLWRLSLPKEEGLAPSQLSSVEQERQAIAIAHLAPTKAHELGLVTSGLGWGVSKRKTELPVELYMNI